MMTVTERRKAFVEFWASLKPIRAFVVGMRVITPSGRVGRLESLPSQGGEDLFLRADVLFAGDESLVRLQVKHLRLYEGPPVMFTDELPPKPALKEGDVIRPAVPVHARVIYR